MKPDAEASGSAPMYGASFHAERMGRTFTQAWDLILDAGYVAMQYVIAASQHRALRMAALRSSH